MKKRHNCVIADVADNVSHKRKNNAVFMNEISDLDVWELIHWNWRLSSSVSIIKLAMHEKKCRRTNTFIIPRNILHPIILKLHQNLLV